MAIDNLARGMAANASGGGGGGVDVGITPGVGIRFDGTDPVEIINTGVTAVTTPGSSGADADAPLGSVKVSNPGALNSADRVHYVVPKGLDNAAYKDVDTEINSSVATSTNLPTTKAVYDELEKKLEADLDTTAFTNDNDHVPSSKLVKEKLDDKLDTTTTINGVSVSSGSYTLDGDDIDLTGYTPISSGSEEDVAATDSINDAVAKVEYKADNRIPTDNIDTDFPVSPDATHVLASTIASATFQGTGTVGVTPKKGLVPAPSTTSGTETRYLKADGTWTTPPNSEYSEGTGIDIDNAGVITNTGVTHIENSDPADDNVGNGTFKVVENGTAKWIAIKGLDDAAYMDVVTSIPATPLDTDLPTSQAVAEYVDDAIDALPKPMVFKGGITLTADSTDTTLCSLTLPSGITTIKEGYTFKVVAIASSPVYTGNIKVGDTLYANKDNAKTTADWVVDTDWTITPSGDEPSGTVTEITASDGIIAYDNATHGSSISDNGNLKLALVTNHTTTANAGDASSTADRSYPLALDGNGKLATNVPWTDTTYEFADSYNASTNKGATVATVTNAIGALDVSGTNAFGAGKTISSWSETDGKVNITSQDISITGSQISDIDTTMPSTAVDTKVPSTKLVKTQLSGKQDTLAFDGTYNASTNKAATVSTVTNAIGALDVSEVSVGSVKTINKISQTDGKISVSTTDIRSASTSQTGIVQLNDTLTSTSTTQAATANAVKAVNDKAETNQSNILYAINTGVKNIINVPDQTQTNGTTVQVADGVVHITGTSTSNVAYTLLEHINLKAGTYFLSGGIGGTAGENFLRLGTQATDAYIMANYSNTPSEFTLNNDTECKLRVYTQGTNLNLTYYPMISILSDGEYVPYALPNYDLTYLQAQDRAALAEEIDAGAKQLAQGQNNSSSAGTATIQSDGYTVKLTGSAASSSSLSFASTGTIQKTGTYVFAIEASGTMDRISIWDNTASASVETLYATGSKEVTLTAGHSYALFHFAGSAMTLNATVKYMICTKAAFGVSNKFVPYRPNYDLVCNGLFPSEYTALQMDTKTSLISGGYCKIGNLVTVSARIEATELIQKGSWIVYSLPKPVASSSISVNSGFSAIVSSPNSTTAADVKLMFGLNTANTAGIFISGNSADMAAGVYTIFGSYLAK